MWAKASPRTFAPAIPLGSASAAQSSPTRATLLGLGGDATGDTLRHMRAFVHASLKSPTQIVRERALSLTSAVASRDWFGQIRELHAFVRDNVRYQEDPDEFELVQSPEKTLQYMAGDCDDQATLLAALLKSLNHPARFVAVGISGGSFSHVLVETKVKDTGVDMRDWCPLETIIAKPMGWYPPDATSRYVLKV